MIIQSLEIRHFGKFRELTLALDPGLNVLTGANEAGKTTMAYFIKAMIFGMDRDSEEQKRFLPFDRDEEYGGSMTVLHEENVYRITRSFFPGRTTLAAEDLTAGAPVTDPAGLLKSA